MWAVEKQQPQQHSSLFRLLLEQCNYTLSFDDGPMHLAHVMSAPCPQQYLIRRIVDVANHGGFLLVGHCGSVRAVSVSMLLFVDTCVLATFVSYRSCCSDWWNVAVAVVALSAFKNAVVTVCFL